MRILVIASNAFSKTQNNGKTIASLLNFADKECIAQLYFGSNEEPDLDICDNYFRITKGDVIKSIFNLSFSTHNSHRNTLLLNKSTDKGFLKSYKNHAKTLACFIELIWKFRTWKTKELFNWIELFKPNIIFAVLGNEIFVHNITNIISKKFNIPFVAYFTDDYFINDYSNNLLQKTHHKLVKRQFYRTMRTSSHVYVIGESMKQDYESIFKIDIGILANAINFKTINPYPKIESDKIVISFIGGLHLQRWKSIVDFAKLTKLIASKNKLKIEIQVFSTLSPEENILKVFNQYKIMYLGYLNPDEVSIQIAKSNFLLHVESFEKVYRLYTKYSVSTKIPEYLSSKKPLIAYGPNEVASIKLISNYNLGCVLTDSYSEEQNLNKLEYFLLNTNEHYEFTKRAYDYSLKRFNQKIIQKQLKHDLNKIIRAYQKFSI